MNPLITAINFLESVLTQRKSKGRAKHFTAMGGKVGLSYSSVGVVFSSSDLEEIFAMMGSIPIIAIFTGNSNAYLEISQCGIDKPCPCRIELASFYQDSVYVELYRIPLMR